MTSPKELLIFDCDGVLVDSEVIAELVLRERLAAWLPDLAIGDELHRALGMTTQAILDHLCARSANALPDAALTHIEAAIERRLGEELEAMAGVEEAIEALELPLAIVSNSSRRRVIASLANTGLDAQFGKAPMFTAEQVAHPKPAPDVYRLAAESLEIAPSDCLVVEDSVSGVSAACAAGMTVIGFTGASHIGPGHGARLRDAGAWQVIAHMAELGALVQRWRSERHAMR
ncbi:HAD superfamily hydrolase (TIGR01493 family)/HAD superfamily hydrolase (TIGR01509 family) [Chromohalobacter marismortui]|uniref:HAD superfamily hydrolase (TIGR01493 family)/HAD superfamily hydrolase (TIGR01509 family) n=1 Tax=Chromohalobacter marismortui TaxID=42055 RepID=A0A4R7NSR9_9GAMM|nr:MULTISPECIES: HAD family phosphatase [Chromohalobacter]MCI0509131.1 HAD family phosphatase [Chromohalobacter sp.]MCI0593083.1 HAD family phosphatase [Chromohalobacter sp.]TDU23977.1 HAD superfamily hydrolase (TIGR01493 family)/HAD superfamily hydrolase (TIGR01509 family) [Chromohalobacter marismortui]